MNSIAVCYLDWLEYPPEYRKRFERSYLEHGPGVGADLMFLEKQEGTDISHYLQAAKELNHEYVCFLGSYSEILAEGWLDCLYFHALDCGLVGATGSWGRLNLPLWPVFPNPHIRSTGFMVNRKLFLSLGFALPQTKRDCYEFESGCDSMTQRVMRRGMYPSVVGRDGKRYWVNEWKESGTFWSGGQENLLVADNKTNDYQDGDRWEREYLQEFAWGN